MSGLVRGLVALPVLPLRAARGLVRAPLGFLLLFLGPRRRALTLPVAGLDEAKAQPIWFALRRAATTREVRSGAEGGSCWAAPCAALAGARARQRLLLGRGERGVIPHCSAALPRAVQEAAIADRWLEALQARDWGQQRRRVVHACMQLPVAREPAG